MGLKLCSNTTALIYQRKHLCCLFLVGIIFIYTKQQKLIFNYVTMINSCAITSRGFVVFPPNLLRIFRGKNLASAPPPRTKLVVQEAIFHQPWNKVHQCAETGIELNYFWREREAPNRVILQVAIKRRLRQRSFGRKRQFIDHGKWHLCRCCWCSCLVRFTDVEEVMEHFCQGLRWRIV